VPGGCSGKKRLAAPRQKRLPEALSEDQVRRLLGGIRNPVHKTCLAVMYACGLRISEATTLGVGAVDRANQVLRIIGKGDKERLVPLPQPVLDDLSWLWRTHRNRRWLFPNHRGNAPLNNRVLSRSFAIAAAAAGIRRGVTPHALRHSYATRLIENGVDIRVVQILHAHPGVAAQSARSPHDQALRRGHDRGRRGVPPLCGGLPRGARRVDAALTSARDR
jgi:site-specific recombinase XerD